MRPKAVGRVRLPHRFPFRRRLNVSFVLGFHCTTFGGFLVPVHCADLVHRAVDGVWVVAVFGFQLVFKKLRHASCPRSIHTFPLLRLKIIGTPRRINFHEAIRPHREPEAPEFRIRDDVRFLAAPTIKRDEVFAVIAAERPILARHVDVMIRGEIHTRSAFSGVTRIALACGGNSCSCQVVGVTFPCCISVSTIRNPRE